MGTKIFGYVRDDNTKTKDVPVECYDDWHGLLVINEDYDSHQVWHGKDITIIGQNINIGTSWEDCSNFNADNNYLTQSTVITSGLKISSNHIGDDYEAGIGAYVVRFDYLDGDYNSQHRYLQLDGITPVEASYPSSNVLRICDLHIIRTSSTSICNTGDIVIASGGTQYMKITSGQCENRSGYYYVPSGKSLMITDQFATPIFGCDHAMGFKIGMEESHDYVGTTYYHEHKRPIGHTVDTYTVMSPSQLIEMPYMVGQKCRVRLRTKSATAGGSGLVMLRGYLVDKQS